MIESPFFSVEEYRERRNTLQATLPKNTVAFISAGSEVTRSNDTEFPFCQDKYFSYLTGFNEPDAMLVLVNSHPSQHLLFCHEKDPAIEVWHGLRLGPQLAEANFGFDLAKPLAELDEHILSLIQNRHCLAYLPSQQQVFEQLNSWLNTLRANKRRTFGLPDALVQCQSELDDMRLIKSPAELKLMQDAGTISAQAHKRAMRSAGAVTFEYQLEAEILHEFHMNGARSAAYNTIVGSGNNANILHYTDNDQKLCDGDLILIDAGCELHGYAADITRTFPVSGTFSEPQAKIYNLVLEAQQAVIDEIKPGQSFAQLNAIANDVLTRGLHNLGILTGDLTQRIKDKACKQYFIHGLGHWLGMDVHDVGDYQINEQKEQCRQFEPGMVMTIEPGLYIPLDADVDKKWQGIGVRIEDNIVVTEHGCTNLTDGVPKSIEDIEALMTRENA